MIIFIYGQDTYRSRQKLQEIIDHYKKIHQSGLNLKLFDEQDFQFQDLMQELQSIPMFQEKKLLILKNTFQNSEFKTRLLENSQRLVGSEDIIIFYEEKEVLQNDPLLKFLAKNAKIQEFELLEGQKLKNWAKNEFEKYQTKIDPPALAKLINYIGNDLWRFSNEIKKLVAFKKTPASAKASAGTEKIEIKDIELLVRAKIETEIFKTIDAIASRDKKRALSLIHQHLEKGDSPLYLLAMINFQFRNILMVKDSRNPKLHPYIIKKSSWQAKKFTKEELKKIYHKLFEIDLAVKTGRLEPKTALDLLITEI